MGHAILKAIKHAADHKLLEVWWTVIWDCTSEADWVQNGRPRGVFEHSSCCGYLHMGFFCQEIISALE